MTTSGETSPTTVEATAAASSKPRRVRTGCLTCRERHLKCDEGLPNCQNCKKSSRICKRGVRLNFIDTTVKSPAMIPPTADWAVKFEDESRLIASEYKGGLSRYAYLNRSTTPTNDALPHNAPHPQSIHIDPQMTSSNPLPPIANTTVQQNNYQNQELPPMMKQEPHSRTNSLVSLHAREGSYSSGQHPVFKTAEPVLTPPIESRDYLNTPQEVLFMQVFVEEVGCWMDSMDPHKHFSRLLPFHALNDPMLLNAFLACGAMHLTLVNPAVYHSDKALHYYDTATTQLLRAMQNRDRDTAMCATTAVILNVYEIMSERAIQRMHHIAGARALIRECQWDARSTGVGNACFWLNIGMELLSCLHFNWQMAWEPDKWGLDMDFSRADEMGKEEVWVHRMLYICAKITNFRATIPKFQQPNAHDEQIRLRSRHEEWVALKGLCDDWNACIPRTMHPLGYLYPNQTSNKSAFPEVWLIKRTAITGRLFYHTAMCLMAQINPLLPITHPEMADMQRQHAFLICGITAHVKDRGVASVSLRSMAIAAETLTDRREQEEVWQIFQRIHKDTGWGINFLFAELQERWGWNREKSVLHPTPANGGAAQVPPFFAGTSSTASGTAAATSTLPPAPKATATLTPSHTPKGGIMNPLLRTADFSLPNHPYQQYYQPPNQVNQVSPAWSYSG